MTSLLAPALTLARPLGLGDLFDQAATPPDDEALLGRLAADPPDESALAALVERYSALVWAASRAGAGGHLADAEDAFQATFVALHRRAGSIRAASTLPAWLHRVAFRAGRAARRRAHQARQRDRAASRPEAVAPRATDRTLADLVRAEVERLPAPYRVAVVLCDLDGLSYGEAAARVGCTEAALRSRLHRARTLLRHRLQGRPRLDLDLGVAGPMPLPLAPPAPRGVVTATLASLRPRSVVAPAVSRLARAASGPTLGLSLRTASVAALLGLGTLLSVAATPHAADPTPTPPPLVAPNPAPAPAPLTPSPADDRPRLRIRVVADGQPVPAARVVVSDDFQPNETRFTGTTGSDGRFDLIFNDSETAAIQDGPPLTVTARATGRGIGVARRVMLNDDLTIALPDAGPPIAGRLVDQSGQPVADARLALRGFFEPKRGLSRVEAAASLTAHLLAADATALLDQLDSGWLSPTEWTTTTDAAGRFAFAEVGADRIAVLECTGSTISPTTLHVVTRPGPTRTYPPGPNTIASPTVLLPPTFEQTLLAPRIVTGVVRDSATNQPLAGWRVGSRTWGGTAESADDHVVTDGEGRYRVAVPTGFLSLGLGFTPPAGQPYLIEQFDDQDRGPYPSARRIAVPQDPTAPITFDLAAQRVALLRGRATDATTGQPVAGTVAFHAFRDPAADPTPNAYPVPYLTERPVGLDGRYELPVPPGRVVVTFTAKEGDRYWAGQGADLVAGFDPAKREIKPAPRHGMLIPVDSYTALADLTINRDQPEATHDFAVEPGQTIALTVLDPEGQPVRDAEFHCMGSRFGGVARGRGPTYTLLGFTATGCRQVQVRHRGRHLAGVRVVYATDGPTQTLQIAPTATIRGRVLVRPGVPHVGGYLVEGPFSRASGPPQLPFDQLLSVTERGPITDAEGRFVLTGLVPGMHYSASISGNRFWGNFCENLILPPGEDRDLGDITLFFPELKESRPPAAPQP